MKARLYWHQIAAFKAQVRDAFTHEELTQLHLRVPSRHLLYAARQFGIVAVCAVALFRIENPLFWIPIAILEGFTFFNMTTLLHEVVHNSVFRGTHPGWERALGLSYAITSGISASQFTRWHLDHHDNLGSEEDDPKRHWLSPKRNARWYKLLYCTPVLMPLYFRAAAREARGYPDDLRRRIGRERLATLVVQLLVMALLYTLGGWGPLIRVQLVPYFLVFPVAFTLNRLGQHYNIDPTHPLKWSTLMKANRFWDFVFLYSNYHLEHHYLPRVPFYNLRKVHERLRPLYASLGLSSHTYSEIVWKWFVLNKAPHTNWQSEDELPGGPGSPTGGEGRGEKETEALSGHAPDEAARPPKEDGADEREKRRPGVAARVATT
jgi:fatty acid desaturase